MTRDRGVSSTVKLPVSKTGLGGSNPSAPAKVLGRKPGTSGGGNGNRDEENGKVNCSEPRREFQRAADVLAGADQELLQRCPDRDEEGDITFLQGSASHHQRGDHHCVSVRALLLGCGHGYRTCDRLGAAHALAPRLTPRQPSTPGTLGTPRKDRNS